MIVDDSKGAGKFFIFIFFCGIFCTAGARSTFSSFGCLPFLGFGSFFGFGCLPFFGGGVGLTGGISSKICCPGVGEYERVILLSDS